MAPGGQGQLGLKLAGEGLGVGPALWGLARPYPMRPAPTLGSKAGALAALFR
jgi:hypothetical protein